jgi:hypothetical protein
MKLDPELRRLAPRPDSNSRGSMERRMPLANSKASNGHPDKRERGFAQYPRRLPAAIIEKAPARCRDTSSMSSPARWPTEPTTYVRSRWATARSAIRDVRRCMLRVGRRCLLVGRRVSNSGRLLPGGWELQRFGSAVLRSLVPASPPMSVTAASPTARASRTSRRRPMRDLSQTSSGSQAAVA